jgi:hypothetical protein
MEVSASARGRRELEGKKSRSIICRTMKCPQLLNSLVLLQFVIVSGFSDEEIDKRRRFNDI